MRSSAKWLPKYDFDGWEPCSWAPHSALIGYVEGLEIEVQTTWTPSHGYFWVVRGYLPSSRSRFPDILESGYSKRVEVAQVRGVNAARKIVTPLVTVSEVERKRLEEEQKARVRERERKRWITPEARARKSAREKAVRAKKRAEREGSAT
jgi:hypothetical protein